MRPESTTDDIHQFRTTHVRNTVWEVPAVLWFLPSVPVSLNYTSYNTPSAAGAFSCSSPINDGIWETLLRTCNKAPCLTQNYLHIYNWVSPEGLFWHCADKNRWRGMTLKKLHLRCLLPPPLGGELWKTISVFWSGVIPCRGSTLVPFFFIDWCQQNHLQLNARNTKELVVDFRRHRQPCTQVNIQET